MVNEWVKVDADDFPTRKYTIGDNVPASKGQLLELLDDRVASGAKTFHPIAGVAAEEHLPGVGETSIGVWTQGLFKVTASQAIVKGSGCAAAELGNRITSSSASLAVASSFAITNGNIRALDSATNDNTLTVRLDC